MVRILTVGIDGPLESYAQGFAEALANVGFTSLSSANQLRLFAHLSRWLARRQIGAKELTEKQIARFLRSRRRAGYTCWRSERGVEPLLRFLRGAGVVPIPLVTQPSTALERVLASYAEHLSNERGLVATTIRARVFHARRFLREHGATRVALLALQADDVRNFLRKLSRTHAPNSLAGVGSDLRSFFRFLFVAGLSRRALAHAVPPGVGWRNRALPRGIDERDLARLLRSCDRKTARGRRALAILLLLTRLGLRAGEVRALTLEDIDWRNGEVIVHGKGSKRERLPLPNDVGHALSAYLVQRPDSEARRIFLRERAPHRPLCSIGAIVFAASQRAGLAPIWPHRLRRTAATQMLRRGASLAEIAEVLRHTSTSTTAIYAKVDRRSLRDLARPWPGARA